VEPTLTLHKLRVFREVVVKQSLTLAAQGLFVSQPVVSAHVRDLEEFFGARLLYQEGRRMLLNEAGQAVYQYVLDVLNSTEDTRSMVRLLQSAEAGTAHIGSSETPGTYVLPQRLIDFKLQVPGAAISLDVGSAFDICEQTQHGLYDFAIVAGPPPAGNLQVDIFSREPLVLVCGSQHPMAQKRFLTREELCEQPFLSLVRRPEPDDRLQELGLVDPQIVMRLGNIEGLKRAVASGLGIAMMFRCSVEHELQMGILCELHVQGVSVVRPLYLVYNRRKRFSPLQQRLLDFLRDQTSGDAELASTGSATDPLPDQGGGDSSTLLRCRSLSSRIP
jgi:DNA-binding transcriptional LysR family regulator